MAFIAPLTSLRFFAALMVVAHHYWGFAPGYAGVGFFFVLSGYVLAINYDGRVDSWPERKAFWFKRLARIYPLYLLTFLLALPLGASLVTIPANLAVLQSWIPFGSFYMSVNKPGWSISNEAFFYALFPLLLGIRWRVLAWWAVAFIILAAVWPPSDPITVRGIESDLTHWLFYIFPPTRLLEFALGVALARTSGKTGGLHETGALLFAAASLAMLPMLPRSFGLTLAFVPASVALVYVFSRSSGPIAKLLSSPAVVLLGNASFALYMIHWPLMVYLGSSVAVAGLAVALSVGVYLYFEKPVQRRLLTNRYRPSSAITAAP